VALITLTEAQRLLGLSTRATLHRKVKSGELRSWPDHKGRPMVESEGLADVWRAIVTVQVKVPKAPAPPRVVADEVENQSQQAATAVAALPPPAPAPPTPPAPRHQEDPPAQRRQHRAPPPASDGPPSELQYGVDEAPDITKERAWAEYEKRMHEHEKRQLTTLTRMREEERLVYREDVEAAQSAINLQIMNRAEALPKQIKLDIPHLTLEEMVVIEKRVMEIFEAVAEHDFEELPE
jgi:predicted GIY-YIG superfamily endonuclease